MMEVFQDFEVMLPAITRFVVWLPALSLLVCQLACVVAGVAISGPMPRSGLAGFRPLSRSSRA